MSPADNSRTSPNRCRRNSSGTRVTNEALSGQYWEDQFVLFPLPKAAPSPCGFRMNCTVCSPLLSLTVTRALLCLSWEPPCQQASSQLLFALFTTQICTTASPQWLQQLLSQSPKVCSWCSPFQTSSTWNHTHSGFSQSNSKIQEMNAEEPIYLPCRPLLLILWLSST